MKYKLELIILTLVFLSGCGSSDNSGSDDPLSYRLKKVVYEKNGIVEAQRTYEYDNNNRLLSSFWQNSSGTSTTTLYYVYDSLGQRVSRHESYASGNTYLNTYTYDSLGNLQQNLQSITFPNTSGRRSTETYSYNNLGLLATISWIGSNWMPHRTTDTYSYDSDGKLVNSYSQGSNGKSSTDTYYYDSSGNYIQFVYHSSSGFSSTATYSNDSYGRHITRTHQLSSEPNNVYVQRYSYENQPCVYFYIPKTYAHSLRNDAFCKN